VSLFLVPILYFPQDHLPVKAQATLRRARGVQLQHELWGELFIPVLGPANSTHLKRSQRYSTMAIPLFLSSVAVWDVSSPKK